jgi:replication factor A1
LWSVPTLPKSSSPPYPANIRLDIIAIVKDVGEVGSITTKAAQKQLTKRELTLVDRTAVQTRLTLWGKQAEDWTLHDQPVIACKGVKVGDFGGRSLSFSSTATMSVNPDIVEAHALRGWYDSMGHNASFTAQAGSGPGGPAMQIKREDFTTLFDVKASEMGRSDKVEYFTARATIVHIKPEPVSYPGCPKCNKKVTEEGDSWRCEKCETSYPAPKYR